MIQRSLKPLGILNQYKGIGGEQNDTNGMYEVLLFYWSQVKATFPEAWNLTSQKSRLMHSAGIRSMGVLMDQIMMRIETSSEPESELKNTSKNETIL